ncbi:hypothetical protein [Pedobacter sp. KACC 23697]|uniref:Uncharacterized protein n=1 Tax=Pedobacter sp. KACC 23697 TaxID=3149230 RepID=A0AAU7KAU4_9SPHI
MKNTTQYPQEAEPIAPQQSAEPNEQIKDEKEEARRIYQEKRKVAMEMIKVGQNDGNYEITKVFIEASEYFVYEIDTVNIAESIRTYIHTEEDEDLNKIMDKYNSIRNCIADAKRDMYKALDPVVYKGRVAHLISQALSGGVTEAQKQFGILIDEVNKEYRHQFLSRIIYLVSALSIVILGLVISFFVYIDKITIVKNLEQFIYIATAGAVGGFISISRRLREMVFARALPRYIFVIYAMERVFISVAGALAVFFIVKSNLALGFLNVKNQNPLYGYIVFSIVAGFSESFLPNLLIKLENKS